LNNARLQCLMLQYRQSKSQLRQSWVSNDVEKHAFLHVHIKEMYVKLVEESSVENNIFNNNVITKTTTTKTIYTLNYFPSHLLVIKCNKMFQAYSARRTCRHPPRRRSSISSRSSIPLPCTRGTTSSVASSTSTLNARPSTSQIRTGSSEDRKRYLYESFRDFKIKNRNMEQMLSFWFNCYIVVYYVF